jgi:hypothetical protein
MSIVAARQAAIDQIGKLEIAGVYEDAGRFTVAVGRTEETSAVDISHIYVYSVRFTHLNFS